MDLSNKLVKPMSLSLIILLVIVNVHVTAFVLESEIQQQFNLSTNAHNYLEEALTIIEKSSVNKQHIDWHSLRMDVYRKASNARFPNETYEAIRLAVSLLKDNHSFFLTPEQFNFLESKNVDESIDIVQSKSTLIDNRMGYLLIPSCHSISQNALKEYATHVQNEIRTLDQHNLNKWIIDLRGNMGGNMWPMVLGLRPLIGEDIFGFFSDGKGEKYAWFYEGQSVKNGDFEMCSLDLPSYQLNQPHPCVAVLIDNHTASAGEATVVAFLGRERTKVFGQNTGGYTSANEVFQLNDGAAIFLATTYLTDRLGRIYENGIIPDETISEEDDGILKAAIEWLYTGSTSNVPFGLKRKLPRFSDRKWVNIKLIWTHLRSLNPGALAQPKRYF